MKMHGGSPGCCTSVQTPFSRPRGLTPLPLNIYEHFRCEEASKKSFHEGRGRGSERSAVIPSIPMPSANRAGPSCPGRQVYNCSGVSNGVTQFLQPWGRGQLWPCGFKELGPQTASRALNFIHLSLSAGAPGNSERWACLFTVGNSRHSDGAIEPASMAKSYDVPVPLEFFLKLVTSQNRCQDSFTFHLLASFTNSIILSLIRFIRGVKDLS